MSKKIEFLNVEFERYFDKMKNEFEKYDFKSLLKAFFFQGHITDIPAGEEISKKDFEDYCFLNFIKDCIENPESMGDKTPSTDYVLISAPCQDRDKCIAFPDRCEDVGCDAPGVCKRYINISKLCGVENAVVVDKNKAPLLTEQEVEQLSDILTHIYKE